jgi:prophage regulatory protein
MHVPPEQCSPYGRSRSASQTVEPCDDLGQVVIPPVRPPPLLLLQREVKEITRLSATTLWRLERRGQFPRRIQLSPKRVAWSRAEVDDWLATRKRDRQVVVAA